MIKVAVLGYGTVGSGVVEVFRENQDILNKNVGEEVEIKYVLDLREFPGDPVEKVLVHDFETCGRGYGRTESFFQLREALSGEWQECMYIQ